VNVGGAGTVAALVSLFALASAPFAGRLFDRYGHVRQLLLASGVLMAVGVGVAFFGTVYSAILAGVLIGLASGSGFTFGFSAARAANRLDQEYEALSVSWVNSISLFGDFVPPLLFSYLVLQYGYSPAWLYMAMLAFVLIIPMLSPRVSTRKPVRVEPHARTTGQASRQENANDSSHCSCAELRSSN
jgi:MFS family permease